MARRKSSSIPSDVATHTDVVKAGQNQTNTSFEEQLKVLMDSLGMEGPPTDTSKWLVIQDENYRPDKDAFILEKFIKDYPNINVEGDCQLIYKLASRSTKLNEWLSESNVSYALGANIPIYYKDILTPKLFEEVSKEAQVLSRANTERAIAERDASGKYRQALDAIEVKYLKGTADVIKTPASYILSLNSTSLPLKIQMAIEKFSPVDAQSPNQKAYAREMLVRFKTSLLKLCKEGVTIDVIKTRIDEVSTK